MERKAFTSLTEASMRILLGETHMIGKTVIVKGKKGNVIKQVGSDGDTESDEIYKVKFEDGTVEDIPARDMEMQGDDNKKIGENELEDIVKEAKYRPTPVSPGSRYPTQAKKTKNTNAHSGIPGMSKKGKGILASMTNSFETGGGPHIDHDNIHNLTHHSVNQTIQMADKHLEDNPHPEASRQLALIKKELQVESVEPKPKKQHGIKSDPAYKQARTSRQIKKARDQYNLRNPEDPWVGESVEVDEATKTEKKIRTVQNRTARAYVRQKTELEPGPKTAKFNRLADRLDQLKRDNQ